MIGIATPLGALRSANSQGIGDLEDLKLLIDWCAQNNFKILQLLPINDTGLESSPYACVSSVALNPIYLRLPASTPFFKYLNHLDWSAYPTIYRLKMDALKQLSFPAVKKTFLEKFPTLQEYAVYKVLKESHNNSSHDHFSAPMRSMKEILASASPQFLEQVDFYLRLQQHLFSEWHQVRLYADQKGVQLMGDLPIVIFRESHEVYFHPEWFNLEFEAGSPPDSFSTEGQNWGQPIYNWSAHEKDHYLFFQQRLAVLESIFSYYRIDHTIGFFRFWQIPRGKSGIHGFFSCTNPKEYLPKAKERLTMLLKSSTMLPIAEDLGIKPVGMDALLTELNIPGMRILRWEEDVDFFPENSLAAISLHDLPLLGSWFKQENNRTINDEERLTLLKAVLQNRSQYKINLLQEFLDLEPLYRFPYDEQERINTPSTVLPTNWTIRMRPYLEELLRNQMLAAKIKSLLESVYD